MITDFFKWWYTSNSGLEYMTFTHCAQHDNVVVWITAILSGLVVVLYSLIGLDAYKRLKKKPNGITKKYLLSKMNVFIFCALTGYGYTLLSVFVNPYKFRVLLLLVLVVWTFIFYKSIKKSNVIDRIFEGEKLLVRKFKEYHDVSVRFQFKEAQNITWLDLKSLSLNEWQVINSIRFKKIIDQETVLVFITEMEAGSEFGKHYHTGCNESVKIVKGNLIDKLNNVKAKEGETVEYGFGKIHCPTATVDSIYMVTFNKA